MRFDNGVFELAAGRSGQLPAGDLPEIVFSGKSNVGKSSLINKLLNRKNLARVSATPGKTATINFTAWIKPGWWICPAMVTPRYPWRRKNAGRSWWKDTSSRKGISP
mgnify:CR=1 FL=1